MREREIEREMERLNTIVRSAGHRFHKGAAAGFGGEAVEWKDPFEELAQREDLARREALVDALEVTQGVLDLVEIPEPLAEKIKEIVFDHFRQYEETLMEWIFAAGPHPLEIFRRFFAYIKMKRASLLWNMGFRSLGPLLKETHASAALRCKLLFGDTPAGWRKGSEARQRMKESALKNCNRRGGKKVRPPAE